jgi:hypothetical protein
MNRAIATILLTLAAFLAPEPVDAGNCWGLKPLCPPGQSPACVCNPLGQCIWMCG